MATKPNQEASSETVVLAKFVQAFKMVNGSYQSQGKVGAAILYENGRYRLLVYRDKQSHLSINMINKDFKFQILPKRYCTFYDKDCIWSILFKELDDLVEFAIEIVKCRWKSMTPPFSKNVVLSQQLTCPDAKIGAVLAEDRVEVSYTIHSFEHSFTGGVQDTAEPQRVEIVVDPNWSRHLVGLELLSKIALVMDVSVLEQLKIPRPPSMHRNNCAVIVTLAVESISKDPPCPDIREFLAPLPSLKHLMPSSLDPVRETKLPVLPTLPSLPNKPPLSVSDKAIDSESDSVILSDNSSRSSRAQRSHKAEVINRVARMGQHLPFNLPTPRKPRSDSDETEDDYLSSGSRGSGRQGVGSGSRAHNRAAHAARNPPPTAGVVVAATTTPQLPLQTTTIPPPYVVYSPTESQAQFNMFCSEVRTTNSELRMYLTRVYDKVEALANRIEGNEHNGNSQLTSVLDRISSNEEQMKQVKDQLQEVLSALKVSNNTSHGRSDGDRGLASAEEIERLQEENTYLKSKSEAQTGALQNARIANRDQLARMESLQNRFVELQAQFAELHNSYKNLQETKSDVEQIVNKLQCTVGEKQITIDRLELALKRSEENCVDEVRQSLREVMDPRAAVADHVKRILNLVHRHIRAQFNPPKQYDAIFIQSVFADMLRGVTLEYLPNYLLGCGNRSPPPQTWSLSTVSTPTSASTNGTNQQGKDNSSTAAVKSSVVIPGYSLTPEPSSLNCSDKSPLPLVDLSKVKKEPEGSDLTENNQQVLLETTDPGHEASGIESLPNVKLAKDTDNGMVNKKQEESVKHSADGVPTVGETKDSTVDQTVEENKDESVEDFRSCCSAQHLDSTGLPKPPPLPLFDEDEDDWFLN